MRQATTLSVSAPTTLIGGEIPLIDVSGYPGRHAGRRRAGRRRAALRLRECRLLLSRRPRRAAVADRQRSMPRPRASTPSRWSEKLAVKVDEHNIGYMPIARKPPPNAAAQGKKPSQNEAYFLRRERDADDPDVLANRRFHAMNKWPAADLPGFRANILLHGHARGAVPQAGAALCAGARPAGGPSSTPASPTPHMILRMSRYPLIDGADDTVASLVPHTDSGFMTLLPPNKVQGLSILLPDGRWMDAPGVEDAFVVNGGDILHRWTNERFLSTPHRVRNVSGAAALRHAVLLRSQPRHHDRVPAVAASRPSNRPSIRRSSSATMRCGSPPSATSTWPRCRRRPKPRSRRARAPRHAGMRRRADVQEHSRAHPVGPVHPADGDAPIIAR